MILKSVFSNFLKHFIAIILDEDKDNSVTVNIQ